MKMTKILSLVLALLMLSVCFVGCGEKPQEETKAKRGPNEVLLWVSTTPGVKEFVEGQVADFIAANPEYAQYTVKVEAIGEGDAAGQVLLDVATAPDMYCFAQDQITRLVQAQALAPLGVQASAKVSEENDAGSVGAATVGGQIYAYPYTSDNGYYLYYDSSVISDEQAKTVEGIVAACRAATKKFGYDHDNGWYTAGYFFSQPVGGGAPLCTSTWVVDDNAKFVGVNDTFNSANGLIALRGMRQLTSQTDVFVSECDKFGGTAAVITGTWNVSNVEAEYGDNMKATKLPTFTVDGVEYQMGSFSGYKLMGCLPQPEGYEAKGAFCQALAQYLTSEKAQLERYFEFQWGPSNKAAQADPDVMDNEILAALAYQNLYAQPQGTIEGKWWDTVALLGTASSTPTKDLAEALAEYEAAIKAAIAK